MDHLPLIAKDKKKYNHDTAPILREAFQDLLCGQIFPKNVSKNMEKYNLKMDALKENAMSTNTVHKNHSLHKAEIQAVEFEIMERQAEYLVNKNFIGNDACKIERIKLKRIKMIRELPQRSVQKYALIENEDLLPYVPERAIDFRMNSNRHLCAQKCDRDLDRYPSKLSKTSEAPKLHKKKPKEIAIFEALPKQVVFSDYELNETYEKKIKLRNITDSTRSVFLKVLPNTKYFTIGVDTSCRVAPGMCAVYYVKYNTDVYHDVSEEVIFGTYTGQDVKVMLKSRRTSPCLRIFIFRTKSIVSKPIKLESLSDEFFDIDRTMALNTSIDCGSTLIGDEVILSIIMKNEGGVGKFFFIMESDWFYSVVQHSTDKTELLAGAFRLYPAYFAMNQNEFSELVLSFCPKKYGLFVETVYLLCNNNTYEELDFMGDGVYFEKSFISFDLKKKESKPFFLDYESDYCLHLGKCLTCTKHKGFVKVMNHSPLNLCYRWILRHSSNPNSKDFKRMASHWITIRRIPVLPAHSCTDFDILFHPETVTPGLYRIVLSLYIENIPEISLRNFQEFTVIEKTVGEKKLLDILMGEIELLCQVEAIDVVIEPNPLIIPFDLPTHASYNQTIKVIPNTNFPLTCEWLPHKSNKKVSLEPETFTLNAETFECEVFVTRAEVENIDEDFLLQVNGELNKFHFKVLVETAIPKASLSTATVDFQNVLLDFNYKQQFRVENNSKVTIQWYVSEYVADLQMGTFTTINGSLNLIPNYGTLNAGESSVVEYTATTHRCGEWLSYLHLFTNFSSPEKPDFSCGIHYQVCRPEILVHTNTSEFPILCPDEILYVGVPVSYRICLHNYGDIVVFFMCGKPSGLSASEFSIVVTPAIGIISIQKNVLVDVTITAKSLGYFEDLYIPVFALGSDNVTLIKLMCLVGDIAVNIHLPDNFDDNDYVQILWPKLRPEVVEEVCAEEYSPIYKAQDDEANMNFESMMVINVNSAATLSQEPKHSTRLFPTPEQESAEHNSTSEDQMVETLFRSSMFGSSKNNTPCSDNAVNFVRPPSRVKSPTLSSSIDSMVVQSLRSIVEKQFGPELTLQEATIEFRAVPIRTPVKKTIKIENITPGSGSFSVEATNFYHTERERDVLNEMLIRMNMAKSSEWENLITADGIVIKVDNEMRSIKGFETIEFDVWLYANTWGYYLDEIVIDISQIVPFCVSVVIEVIGQPIEFPIAYNTICEEPTLRLGNLSYNCTTKHSRKLKVVNTSVVPISVSWHLFVNFNEAERPFSVIFDMVDTGPQEGSDEDFRGEFLLTDKYYGVSNNEYFEVRPILSYIEPQGFAYVEITTNVCNFEEDHFRKQLEANLLGVIRVSNKFRYLPNIYTRLDGINLKLARVRITLEISSPELPIDAMPNRMEIVAYATDIMETQVFSHRRRFTIRNAGVSSAAVYFQIAKPFSIFCVNKLGSCITEFTHSITLLSRECMEVIVECALTSEEVLKMVETLRSNIQDLDAARPNFYENSLKISKKLSLYQEGQLIKVIPLELKIFYPIFKANPGSFAFGDVYVGNTAKGSLTLRNLTASTIRYEIYKCNKTREVIASPQSGMIPKISEGGLSTLNIFFSPSESRFYEEWIAITTTVAHHYVIINITGAGTYDEKYYEPGLH